jgi:hypothetical protein
MLTQIQEHVRLDSPILHVTIIREHVLILRTCSWYPRGREGEGTGENKARRDREDRAGETSAGVA